MSSDEVQDPTDLRYYGSEMTIHDGGEVNVEIDKDGNVVAVWFRCQPIRFDVSVADPRRAHEMVNMYTYSCPPPLEAVVLRENGPVA